MKQNVATIVSLLLLIGVFNFDMHDKTETYITLLCILPIMISFFSNEVILTCFVGVSCSLFIVVEEVSQRGLIHLRNPLTAMGHMSVLHFLAILLIIGLDMTMVLLLIIIEESERLETEHIRKLNLEITK